MTRSDALEMLRRGQSAVVITKSPIPGHIGKRLQLVGVYDADDAKVVLESYGLGLYCSVALADIEPAVEVTPPARPAPAGPPTTRREWKSGDRVIDTDGVVCYLDHPFASKRGSWWSASEGTSYNGFYKHREVNVAFAVYEPGPEAKPTGEGQGVDPGSEPPTSEVRKDALLERALKIIAKAIVAGMPVDREVASVRNLICQELRR